MNPTLPDTPSQRPRGVRMLAVLASAALMAACGGGDKGASQTAARVNKDEVTVHQINFVLQQQRGLKPEQADARCSSDSSTSSSRCRRPTT